MPVTLPPGWVINTLVEHVPDPNGIAAPFARWTSVCTDEMGQFVCASGALEDCESQAQAMAQARTQQQPYYEENP
jgi:hypothetical protein